MADYSVTLTDTVGISDGPILLEMYVAPVYTNVELVCQFLQVDLPTAGPGSFGWDYIENTIRRMEDRIDRITWKSWKPRTIVDEYHELSLLGFKLGHRPIRHMLKVEIWRDGWSELIEGRSNQYWVDNRLGVLYFTRNIWYPGGYMRYRLRKLPRYQSIIRVSYVYGWSLRDDWAQGVRGYRYPGLIEDLCTKLVAMELASSSDYTRIFPTGMDNIPLPEKVEDWKLDTDEMFETLMDVVMF